MDNSDGHNHDEAVRLGTAVKERLVEMGRPQRWLAEQLGMNDGHLSRVLAGRERGALTLDFVRRVEDALGFRRGELLRLGGYVDEHVTAEVAIANDTALTPSRRRALRSMYRELAQ